MEPWIEPCPLSHANVPSLKLPLQQGDVGIDHDANQLLKGHLCGPAEALLRLGGIANEQIDFRRSQVACVEGDVFLPVQAGVAEGFFEKFADTVRFSGGNDI